MPVPTSPRVRSEFASVQISSRVFLAKLDRTSRFSFIKKSVISELDFLSQFSLVLLPISCGNLQDFIVFEKRENLPYEVVLGTYAIKILKIE